MKVFESFNLLQLINFEKKFREMPFEDVAFPRGCRYIHKWSSASDIYRKGTPIHVRAALMYKQMLAADRIMHSARGPKVRAVWLAGQL